MFEKQRFLLERQPSRVELLNYVLSSTNSKKICVYRNHSFELVEHTIKAYLDFSNIRASFVYSDYDDSLSFLTVDNTADILILWLDISRYKINNVGIFINERIASLRSVFEKPIIFVGVNGNINITDKSVVCVDLSHIENALGQYFLDARMEVASGTKLSAKALMSISKELGLKYVPSVVYPSLKAIVIDLDNTIYKGVLGEDGIDGIELTDGHKRLQVLLHKKATEGFFVCVASKNDKKDVCDMFEKRTDFPLKESDLTVIEASWNSKSESMKSILRLLNINEESVLFIDDNLGEQMQMLLDFPSIKEIHALDDANTTTDVLEYYPGLMKVNGQKEDALRKEDVKANEERKQMQEMFSKSDYIKSLDMELVFSIDNTSSATRIAELANKTNQFIFSYKRYDLPAVERLISERDSVVVSASLSDKLSDSGTIAVCVGIKENDVLIIDECFVSCRALGRGIDDIIVLGMIKLIAQQLKTKKLKVCFKKGERNLPAEKFVAEYLKEYENKTAPMNICIDESLVKITIERG